MIVFALSKEDYFQNLVYFHVHQKPFEKESPPIDMADKNIFRLLISLASLSLPLSSLR